MKVVPVPRPTVDPPERPADVTTDSYQPGQPVWVHRSDAWRPGVVLHATARAVTVRYRPASGRGTGVDTVTGELLAVREDPDADLDRIASGYGLATPVSF
jgi:hypothetical protein